MATTVPRWLKWAGVVCLFAVLVAAGLTLGGFFFLRSSFRQVEAADRSFETVAARYGGISSYRPAPDGSIPSDKLEAFLASRDRAHPQRKRMEKALVLLRDDRQPRGPLPKFRGSLGLMRNLGPFHRARNEALIEEELGLGEYYYLYTLAYYSWLGKSPADGPTFQIVGEHGYLLESLEPQPEAAVRRDREDLARRSLNRLLLPVLRNQLADLSNQQDGDSETMEQALLAEIDALEADAQRLPWEDGLPGAIEQSLLPYEQRLRDSYSVECNAIEIGLVRRSTSSLAQEG